MMAGFSCSYSNYRWSQLFYRQDMASFLEAHVQFIQHLSFEPRAMVYDNMKMAVAKFAYRSWEKPPTEELLKFSVYYQFGYRFCNVRKGNEKGHVERSVEYRRKAFLQANEFFQQKCIQLNALKANGKQHSIQQALEQEKPQMQPARSP